MAVFQPLLVEPGAYRPMPSRPVSELVEHLALPAIDRDREEMEREGCASPPYSHTEIADAAAELMHDPAELRRMTHVAASSGCIREIGKPS
jgi:hypothetical protein